MVNIEEFYFVIYRAFPRSDVRWSRFLCHINKYSFLMVVEFGLFRQKLNAVIGGIDVAVRPIMPTSNTSLQQAVRMG